MGLNLDEWTLAATVAGLLVAGVAAVASVVSARASRRSQKAAERQAAQICGVELELRPVHTRASEANMMFGAIVNVGTEVALNVRIDCELPDVTIIEAQPKDLTKRQDELRFSYEEPPNDGYTRHLAVHFDRAPEVGGGTETVALDIGVLKGLEDESLSG